jgi:septal ring factor EnvC (AmiA/AmiB activator)
MSDVAEARQKLIEYADELDKLSKDLADVQRRLEPIETFYNDSIDDYIASLFERWESGESKWPSDDVRMKLARRAMDREVRDQYDALCASRDRMRKRISDLKSSVEAQRSVLSALGAPLQGRHTGSRGRR